MNPKQTTIPNSEDFLRFDLIVLFWATSRKAFINKDTPVGVSSIKDKAFNFNKVEEGSDICGDKLFNWCLESARFELAG